MMSPLGQIPKFSLYIPHIPAKNGSKIKGNENCDIGLNFAPSTNIRKHPIVFDIIKICFKSIPGLGPGMTGALFGACPNITQASIVRFQMVILDVAFRPGANHMRHA